MNVLINNYKTVFFYRALVVFFFGVELFLSQSLAEDINLTIAAGSNPDLASDVLYREFKSKLQYG